MSVVDDRRDAAPVARRPRRAPRAHLGRAEGIELLGHVDGSGYKAGAALVRRADGQMVQLGALLYALLEASTASGASTSSPPRCRERIGAGVEHRARRRARARSSPRRACSRAPRTPRRQAQPAAGAAVEGARHRPGRHDAGSRGRSRSSSARGSSSRSLAGFAATLWFVARREGHRLGDRAGLRPPGAAAADHRAGGRCRPASTSSATPRPAGTAARRPAASASGLYLVWPAFYTDVTDAYRLPRARPPARRPRRPVLQRARRRRDAWASGCSRGIDALLLLVALQLIEMVKQLSPVIRADGYHILVRPHGRPGPLRAHRPDAAPAPARPPRAVRAARPRAGRS